MTSSLSLWVCLVILLAVASPSVHGSESGNLRAAFSTPTDWVESAIPFMRWGFEVEAVEQLDESLQKYTCMSRLAAFTTSQVLKALVPYPPSRAVAGNVAQAIAASHSHSSLGQEELKEDAPGESAQALHVVSTVVPDGADSAASDSAVDGSPTSVASVIAQAPVSGSQPGAPTAPAIPVFALGFDLLSGAAPAPDVRTCEGLAPPTMGEICRIERVLAAMVQCCLARGVKHRRAFLTAARRAESLFSSETLSVQHQTSAYFLKSAVLEAPTANGELVSTLLGSTLNPPIRDLLFRGRVEATYARNCKELGALFAGKGRLTQFAIKYRRSVHASAGEWAQVQRVIAGGDSDQATVRIRALATLAAQHLGPKVDSMSAEQAGPELMDEVVRALEFELGDLKSAMYKIGCPQLEFIEQLAFEQRLTSDDWLAARPRPNGGTTASAAATTIQIPSPYSWRDSNKQPPCNVLYAALGMAAIVTDAYETDFRYVCPIIRRHYTTMHLESVPHVKQERSEALEMACNRYMSRLTQPEPDRDTLLDEVKEEGSFEMLPQMVTGDSNVAIRVRPASENACTGKNVLLHFLHQSQASTSGPLAWLWRAMDEIAEHQGSRHRCRGLRCLIGPATTCRDGQCMQIARRFCTGLNCFGRTTDERGVYTRLSTRDQDDQETAQADSLLNQAR